MTQEEFNERAELHKKWLNGEQDGERLTLKNADLRYLDLSYKDLRNADLSFLDMRNADLSYADLCEADLSRSTLSFANLRSADLRSADLRDVDLSDATLCSADLENAILTRAILKGADLRDANLVEANLHDACLEYSNLSCAKVSDTERYRFGMVLKKSIIGWKECRGHKIVKLRIPKGAVVFSINGTKCRCNKAKVISINNGSEEYAISFRSKDFMYVPNKTLEIDDFDLRYNVECSTGIHFFKTRKEAEEY